LFFLYLYVTRPSHDEAISGKKELATWDGFFLERNYMQYDEPFQSYEDQISLLKERGMSFKDEERAQSLIHKHNINNNERRCQKQRRIHKVFQRKVSK